MFKGILQYNEEDCGAACLATILRFYGQSIPFSDIKRKLAYGKDGANILGIVEVAKEYNLNSKSLKGNFNELKEGIQNNEFQLPIIVHTVLKNGSGHFLILRKILDGKVKVFDPSVGKRKLSFKEFEDMWTGYIIGFEKQEELKNIKIPSKKYEAFLKEFFSQKKYILNLIVASIFITIISYLSASFIKIIVDNYILQGKKLNSSIELFNFIVINVKFIIVLIIAILFIQLILNIFKGIITSKISKKLNFDFSNFLYKKILNLKSVFFNRMESGEITSRFQSIISLQQLLINSFLTITLESICSIFGGIVLFTINPKLFMIVCIMIIIYALLVTLFIPKLKKFNKQFYSKYSESLTFFSQTLRGIDTLKISNSQNWFRKKFLNTISKSSEYQYKSQKYGSILNSLVSFIDSIGTFIILVFGAGLVTSGNISLGSLISFQALMYLFLDPLKSIILLQDELQNLSVTIGRLNDILKEPSEDEENDAYLQITTFENFEIELFNVSYSDGFNFPIINNINLFIKQGQHIGIIGPSGSGKTTLLKILATINSPTQGDYLIGNVPIQNYSLEYIRSNIAYVEQEPHIFPATVKENLLMGKVFPEDSKYFDLVCTACGIYDFNELEKSILNFKLIEDGNNLSGGQKQKIGLARALLKKPKLLILDEATSNLDSESEKNIYEFLKNLGKKITIINVSHNDYINKYANNLVYMKEGTISFKNIIDN